MGSLGAARVDKRGCDAADDIEDPLPLIGAFQQLPSSEAGFTSPETRADFERYFRGATASARERVKVLKLVWDFVGSEFAGRQLQYEMFYSAAQPVVNRRMYRAYDWRAATALVDRLLGEY